jgi:D-amino-acid oxidase
VSHVDRRALLKNAAVAAAALTLPSACRTIAAPVTPAPRVRASEDRIIRNVTGLRPYRRTSFRVEAEKLGDKLIVHNYGHGGCGVTLSWGTAEMAAQLAIASDARRAAVLGCGVVGLATARVLQERGFDVTIYTKALPPHTTSNVAGALWLPTTIGDHDLVTPEIRAALRTACHISHQRFQLMAGSRYGVRWLPLYFTGAKPQILDWEWDEFADLIHDHPKPERNFGKPFTRATHAMLIEPNTYLPAVIEDFHAAGGKIVVRAFDDVSQIATLSEPLVMNCTGLASRTLFADAMLMPIKGQLTVLLPQPELDYMYIDKSGLYMFPRSDGVILGGTFERGVESMEVLPAVTQRLLEGHARYAAGVS